MVKEVQFILSLAFSVLLFLVGSACVFKTNAIREYTIKKANHRFNLFFGFMKSDQYIWNLRICGLLIMAMSCIMAFVLLPKSL